MLLWHSRGKPGKLQQLPPPQTSPRPGACPRTAPYTQGARPHPAPPLHPGPQSKLLGVDQPAGDKEPPPLLVWRRLRAWRGAAEKLWGAAALAEWLGTDRLADEVCGGGGLGGGGFGGCKGGKRGP